MVLNVSDVVSHRRDQIGNLTELLENSPTKQALVKAVYFGKRRFKSVVALADKMAITPKRVTEIGKPLVGLFFGQQKIRENGKSVTAYVKYDSVQQNLKKILQLSNDKKKRSTYHNKTNPKITIRTIKVRVLFTPKTASISIDEVREFDKTKKIKAIPPAMSPARLPEAAIKKGLIRLLGEYADPKDWGGELNDIFTTRMTVRGKRRRAAFALKGPAKTGPLVPGKMGKNGDQISRLFKSPAQVFFVQYEGEIKESVIDLMSKLAYAKAAIEHEVFYGIIDLKDTYRLRLAYPKTFRASTV
ncbi:MAG: hypothetical protein O7A06_08835 [Acidobacteria bacterium]|nr:hypothetical protein [Acidobacteriota bacterium]MCZ6750766.1 hypothetical protein [Acidobacteriota bacterium]